MQRFLVVEDHPDLCEVMKEGLEQFCNASVHCAHNGETATRLLAASRPNLAVIDLVLPDISGFDLADFAAAQHVPALLITGYPEQQEACAQLGYPYLPKPFRLHALAELAQRTLQDVHENLRRLRESRAALLRTVTASMQLVQHSERILAESARLVDQKKTPPKGGVSFVKSAELKA